MSRITELTEATDIANDDELVFVDISDTTMAPTGTTKKIKRSNLATGIITEIGRQSGLQPSFNFAAIPQDYDFIFMKGYVKSNDVDDVDGINVWINGDTNVANYWRQINEGQNGQGLNSEGAVNAIMPAPASTSFAEWNSFQINFNLYRLVTQQMMESSCVLARTNAYTYMTDRMVLHTATPQTITSLTMAPDNGTAIDGLVILYGIG